MLETGVIYSVRGYSIWPTLEPPVKRPLVVRGLN